MNNIEDLTPEERSVEETLRRLKPTGVSEAWLTEIQGQMDGSILSDSGSSQYKDLENPSAPTTKAVSIRTFLSTIAAILMLEPDVTTDLEPDAAVSELNIELVPAKDLEEADGVI